MNIIASGIGETKNIAQCLTCGAILEYNKDDVTNDGFVRCPCCDSSISASFEITLDSVKFPNDFIHMRGVDISNSHIQSWIDDCKKEVNADIGIDTCSVSSGNTLVQIREFKDEYQIIVAKDYWFAEIPK